MCKFMNKRIGVVRGGLQDEIDEDLGSRKVNFTFESLGTQFVGS